MFLKFSGGSFIISDEFFMHLFWGTFFDFFLVRKSLLDPNKPLEVSDFILQNDLTLENIMLVGWFFMLIFWLIFYFLVYFFAIWFDFFFYLWHTRRVNRGRFRKYWSLFVYIIYELPDWLTEYVAFNFRKLAFRNIEPHSIRTIPESSVIHNRIIFVQLTFLSFIVSDILDCLKSTVIILRFWGFLFCLCFDIFLVSYFILKFIFYCFFFIFKFIFKFFFFFFFEILHIFIFFYCFLKNFILYCWLFVDLYIYIFYRVFSSFFEFKKNNSFFLFDFFFILSKLQTDKIICNYFYIQLLKAPQFFFFFVLIFIFIIVCFFIFL